MIFQCLLEPYLIQRILIGFEAILEKILNLFLGTKTPSAVIFGGSTREEGKAPLVLQILQWHCKLPQLPASARYISCHLCITTAEKSEQLILTWINSRSTAAFICLCFQNLRILCRIVFFSLQNTFVLNYYLPIIYRTKLKFYIFQHSKKNI